MSKANFSAKIDYDYSARLQVLSSESLTVYATPPTSPAKVLVLPAKDYSKEELDRLITTHTGDNKKLSTYWRTINSSEVEKTIENGTDRDSTSIVYSIRGDQRTMVENGITDAGKVTCLHTIDRGVLAPSISESVLIYASKGVDRLTTTNPNNPFPNNKFYHFSEDPKNSILAIITADKEPTPPQPQIPPAAQVDRKYGLS